MNEIGECLQLLKESYKVIPEFRSFLFSYKIENKQKIKALGNIFGDDFTDLLSNFMRTLLENKRQDLISDISASYNLKAMKSKNQLPVKAVTHEKLSDALIGKVKNSLEKVLDKNFKIKTK